LGGFNPARWTGFVKYLFGPFAVGLYKANIDVAARVITGKINPGIVKLRPGLKTEEGLTFLANSITLTPGTLTVDVDDEGALYIHCLNLDSETPTEEEICGPFAKWPRRLFG
jgi:multicomponent Na+:H+ antiporter subunit E